MRLARKSRIDFKLLAASLLETGNENDERPIWIEREKRSEVD
jgi:hypothetical protein